MVQCQPRFPVAFFVPYFNRNGGGFSNWTVIVVNIRYLSRLVDGSSLKVLFLFACLL